MYQHCGIGEVGDSIEFVGEIIVIGETVQLLRKKFLGNLFRLGIFFEFAQTTQAGPDS